MKGRESQNTKHNTRNIKINMSKKIIIYITLTGIIVGGLVYGWQRNNYKKTKRHYESKIVILDTEINELRDEIIQKKEERLTFITDTNRSSDNQSNIWTIKTDGTKPRPTNIFLKEKSNILALQMIQSPDLKYTAIIDGNQKVGIELYLFDIKKEKIQKISNSFFPYTPEYDGSWIEDIAWSSDSKKVAYKVTHHSYEPTLERGVVTKDKPPLEFNDKMGVFVYNIETKKTEKIASLEESNSTWLEIQKDNDSWIWWR
jgi:hypothetical protein